MNSSPAAVERFPWAAVSLLALALAVRYPSYSLSPEPLLDEIVYVDAGRAILQGVSPYGGTYLYLPAFAWAVGQFFALFGETPFLLLLRVANICAAAAFGWLGARKSGFGSRACWTWAASFLLLSPAVFSSVETGNPTFLVGLLVLLGLELAARRPLAAGFLIGASMLVKPLAPGAVAWLTGSRFAGGKGTATRRGFLAAAVAGAFFLLGFLPLGLAADFLGQVPPGPSLEHNPSLYRLLESAGAGVPPMVFTGLVCLAALGIAAWRERDPVETYLWALPAMFLASPLVWNHTLAISWPIQAAALGIAWRRGRLETAAVLLVMVLLACWHGIHALPPHADFARWVFTAAPALAPAGLAAYCLLAKRRTA
jgi:hypothetical protein